jgi:hydrogenase nickel incorporation protein HypA/HybF
MHEVSIAQNLLDIVSRQCIEKGFTEIESINIRVGRASGILPDALLFAFNAIKPDSIARNAKLSIAEVPVTGHCSDCEDTFISEQEYIFCCPICEGTSFVVTNGRELDIVDMEVT